MIHKELNWTFPKVEFPLRLKPNPILIKCSWCIWDEISNIIKGVLLYFNNSSFFILFLSLHIFSLSPFLKAENFVSDFTSPYVSNWSVFLTEDLKK